MQHGFSQFEIQNENEWLIVLCLPSVYLIVTVWSPGRTTNIRNEMIYLRLHFSTPIARKRLHVCLVCITQECLGNILFLIYLFIFKIEMHLCSYMGLCLFAMPLVSITTSPNWESTLEELGLRPFGINLWQRESPIDFMGNERNL